MSQFFESGGPGIGISASASNEYSGLISFRIDWFDLLAVQGTPKSLLQHHSSLAGITGADSSIIGKKQKLTQHYKAIILQ